MICINNRRYIGNKTKLLEHIWQCAKNCGAKPGDTFADLFAGTGIVSYFFAKNGFKIIANDILFSNFAAYKAWLGNENFSTQKIKNALNFFNSINANALKENYFSKIYGEKYFSKNDAKKIGFIRDELQKRKSEFSEREFFILLSSLMYSADKIANTVGHFEYFLKKPPCDSNFVLEELDLSLKANAKIFNCDANSLAKKIKAEIVYIDPPYNARQYINFYHVLENLARWQKPKEFEGISMKFKREELKSGYSKSCAFKLFCNLIKSLDCKFIIVSYSNTYSAKSSSSINKISQEQIESALLQKGDVKKIEIPYNAFNAGKTNLQEHKEFLFACKVRSGL